MEMLIIDYVEEVTASSGGVLRGPSQRVAAVLRRDYKLQTDSASSWAGQMSL